MQSNKTEGFDFWRIFKELLHEIKKKFLIFEIVPLMFIISIEVKIGPKTDDLACVRVRLILNEQRKLFQSIIYKY